VDDPLEARCRTLTNSAGTPIALPRICVDWASLAEPVESRLLIVVRLIAQRDLILLRRARVGLRPFAAELRGQVAVARRVIRRGCVVGSAFAQRVIRRVCRTQILLRDVGRLLRRVARAG
jgi:hypothetical protein